MNETETKPIIRINKPNPQQIARVSALKRAYYDHGQKIVEGFFGDMIWDALVLTASTGPCILVFHQCGSQLMTNMKMAHGVERAYGENEKRVWLWGEENTKKDGPAYQFTPTPMAECILRLSKCQVIEEE